MALATINVEKNARSANMELLHRKSSSQNFTGQQYFWGVFGSWRGNVASHTTDERAKNDQKERGRLNLEKIKRPIISSSEKFRRLLCHSVTLIRAHLDICAPRTLKSHPPRGTTRFLTICKQTHCSSFFLSHKRPPTCATKGPRIVNIVCTRWKKRTNA